MAENRHFQRTSRGTGQGNQEPRRPSRIPGSMQSTHQTGLINSAAACRMKAETLRSEANTLSPDDTIRSLLHRLAEKWDALAENYGTEKKVAAQRI